MVRRAVQLFCDNEHGSGDVTFPDMVSEFDWQSGESVVALRRRARAAGWRRIQNADYCPICVPSILGIESEEA